MNSVVPTNPVHLDITLEQDAMVNDIKKAIKLMRGIASVKLVHTKTAKKSGIEKALDDVKDGRVYHAKSVDDLFKQILG